jgi:GxxExxY protein
LREEGITTDGAPMITEKKIELLYEETTYKIIGAAIEVHRELGPGYLESVYEDALCYELEKLSIGFSRQKELDVNTRIPSSGEDSRQT